MREEGHKAGPVDMAGSAYWEAGWDGAEIGDSIDPDNFRFKDHVYRCFHRFFLRSFEPFETKGAELIEVGCGGSRWLPYFARRFGFHVTGLGLFGSRSETGGKKDGK